MKYSASDYSGASQSEAAADARNAGLSLEPGSYSQSRNAGERDAKMDAMAAAPARSASLLDQASADNGPWSTLNRSCARWEN